MKQPIIITTTYHRATPRSATMIVCSNQPLPHNFEEKLQKFIMAELEAEQTMTNLLNDMQSDMNGGNENE